MSVSFTFNMSIFLLSFQSPLRCGVSCKTCNLTGEGISINQIFIVCLLRERHCAKLGLSRVLRRVGGKVFFFFKETLRGSMSNEGKAV